jgi:hypothetical protein
VDLLTAVRWISDWPPPKGQTAGTGDIAMGDTSATLFIPAPIILKAKLTKGIHWKDGPPNHMRACEVVDFVTVKVPAGEYKNVVKLLVKLSYISHETGREQYLPSNGLGFYEYYAPNVGLVKVDLPNKDGPTTPFMDLISYTPGTP